LAAKRLPYYGLCVTTAGVSTDFRECLPIPPAKIIKERTWYEWKKGALWKHALIVVESQ